MTDVQGDPALAADLRAALGRRHPVAAVARVHENGTRVAAIGADVTADFEIGSVSKAVTGLLYADAMDRGEIDGTTVLADLLPLSGTSVGAIRLTSLSTHRSGLPRLPTGSQPLRRTIDLWRHGSNPYGEDVATLVEQAARTRVGSPTPRYSNLGFELLGHALGLAAGLDYPTLVRRRLAEPLRLSTLYAPATPEDLRLTSLAGRSHSGRPRAPWTGAAVAPAGGLRASIEDMATLARAVLTGDAPGTTALDPVSQYTRRVAIGAGWITVDRGDGQITWHNGGTGGFRSWIGVDRVRGTGLVLLTATAAPIDRHAFHMFEAPSLAG